MGAPGSQSSNEVVKNLPAGSAYSLTNVTTSRTLDADTATAAQIADVLCTLIEDLAAAGALTTS